MKKIGQFLNKKSLYRPAAIDEKSVFIVFEMIIKEEYGRQGAQNIKPKFLKDKKIFISVSGENWPNEIWLNKSFILKRINEQLGREDIIDLAIAN